VTALRDSLDEFVALIERSVAPETVDLILDGGTAETGPIVVRPLSVERVGRSRREGPVLDLRLTASVHCVGPRGLDAIESIFRALESSGSYSIGTLANDVSAGNNGGLGFVTSMPVSLRLDEPTGPPVLTPLEVRTELITH